MAARRRGLGGRIGRGSRLARTGVRSVSGVANSRVRGWLGQEVDETEAHVRNAEALADVLGEMKGAAMKVGQLLSFVDLDVPDDVRDIYHEALAELRDAAPPMDVEAIEEVFKEDFGQRPEEVFATWDRTPLAAASIGQVHAATLEDGSEVVVKVQYPGVAEAVRSDLSNAEMFAPLARVLSPNQEIEPLLDELRERVNDELDYQREAQYQRAFADRYADHPFIVVPDVVGDLCRNRVLVSERIHGRRFDDVATSDDEELRQRVGEIIFRYAFGSIARFRLFNGDPHPGNYLVTDDGRVAFVDYGSVKMFTRERYVTMRLVDDAVARDDREGFLEAMRETRFLLPRADVDEDRLWEWFRLYTRPIIADQPFTFTREFATEVLATTSDPRSPYYGVLRRLNLPSDYLLLTRIHLGLNSVLGRLDASNDWRAIHAEYVEDAGPATPLGELDHVWWARKQASGRG
ncbi:ABC1 kinase family protein [Salsipaludibacter albus]|uniref:ABC1 kinase family protein n=1 Tax=Salsipaludibacter albus TaxID=2849650 RepID=UPI001EE41D2A|nr:AarF/ABC1/UbiB kinase family protein [Salsipaludibacter albus]MBY5161674.1 AarF/ABC1/UbiB kinase family protein [Salsipaludibacter albus]